MKVSDQNKIEKHAETISAGLAYLASLSKSKHFDADQEGRYWDVGLQLIDRLRETLGEIEKIGQIYAGGKDDS